MPTDIGCVIEGNCPVHRTPLEREHKHDRLSLDPFGYCEACHLGYSVKDGTTYVHIITGGLYGVGVTSDTDD